MISYLICFDISDDATRAKIARTLEQYGIRVQYSVFQCHFRTDAHKNHLHLKLHAITNQKKEYSAKIYFYNLSKATIAQSHDLHNRPIGMQPAYVIL